jgi:hypothetical protein
LQTHDGDLFYGIGFSDMFLLYYELALEMIRLIVMWVRVPGSGVSAFCRRYVIIDFEFEIDGSSAGQTENIVCGLRRQRQHAI